MANGPANPGDKVEGVVVRAVAVRGGYEYVVRVAADDAPATVPVKLPAGYNHEAAYGTDEEREVIDEQNRRDEAERDKVEKAIANERRAYVEREEAPVRKESTVDDDTKEKDSGATPPAGAKPSSPATNPKSAEAGKRNR